MSPTYQLFRRAMLEAKQVLFTYQGREREACPHAIGYKNGLEKVLIFQFAGESNSGLIAGGQWRCVFVSEIKNLSLRAGPWKTRNKHTQPQTCIDLIDVEIRLSPDQTPVPYVYRA